MIKNIIREVAPEACDFRTYFEDDGLTRAAGDYCYTLFIVSNEGWGRISGFNLDEYYADTFSPEVDPLTVIDFSVKGKNYRERQSSVQTIAIDFQTADIGGLFMSDYARIGEWFTTNGKRYGLIKEFQENGIVA